ncbi:MAG TPA: hypothetical protein DHW71_02875 [Gammaproteobacteria bacterium]|nr:hypothetical protein [Gammaproteobacteria bacterium]HBF10072.1 hypothetical protein [Gammaproteobacteria bacterium]HCK91900.1 hypothetical protein [Gammaproteobacteria bacterium]
MSEDIQCQFTGKGKSYFRIWISNIFLNIITVGLYMPWAKVRTLQFFYSHTYAGEDNFKFTGNPWKMFKNRVIALLVLGILSLCSQFISGFENLVSVFVMLIMPWVIVLSLRFYARHTRYRGVFFQFKGTVWGATQVFILFPLINVVTLFLLSPWLAKKHQEYICNNYYYGKTPFELQVSAKTYYKMFMFITLVTIAGLLVSGLFGAIIDRFFFFLGLYITFFAVKNIFALQLKKIMFDHLNIKSFRFKADYQDSPFLKIAASNFILTLLTLGFYFPWAKVRTMAYFTDHLEIRGDSSLDEFISHEVENVKALGEELGDVLDIDVGFI